MNLTIDEAKFIRELILVSDSEYLRLGKELIPKLEKYIKNEKEKINQQNEVEIIGDA